MTHTERLEYCFDGSIPPRLKAAATALDAVEARAARKPVRLRIIKLKPAAITENMAQAMVRWRTETGCCHAANLRADGFTTAEIDLYGDRARDRASLIWRQPN